jgi:Clp amino terminal domain, pathogenicity island component
MEPIPRSVDATRSAGRASGLARMEARRLGHHYLSAEHLLVGLLLEGDNLAARVLVAHGLDLETVRAGVDRLIAQGVLPGPQPSDGELLATLGVDLEAVHARSQATFGEHAYWEAAQRVRRRPNQPVTHTPHISTDPTPLLCGRALHIAANEAIARDQDVGPEHLLLGLLRDAEDPVETDLAPQDRRQRVLLGLPDHGPHPIKLLVESRGLTLDRLRTALLSELDQDY